MKFATVSKSLLMGAALLLATGAFAATAKMELNNPTTISGTKLKPGNYKLQWDGTGPNVEVSVVKGKDVVAKVPAKVVDLSTPAQNDALLYSASDGNTLSGIRFAGKTFGLDLTSSGDGGGSSK